MTGASWKSSLISLIKTIVGAGMLSMPLAYSADGTIFGSFTIIVAALTSGFGLFLQCYVSQYVPEGHATFFNLSSISYPSLLVVFDVAIAIQCFGTAVSYVVLVGDIMSQIVSHVPLVAPLATKTFWMLSSAVVCVPLSFLKNLDSLKYTSILGLAAVAYVAFLTVVHYLLGDVTPPDRGDLTLFPVSAKGVLSTFPIVVLAFTGHQNMFSIINEARDKSLAGLTRLVVFGIAVSTACFSAVGLAGYFTFGEKVNANVILLYPPSAASFLGRVAIVFMVIFSFPLMLHPARISANNIYFWSVCQWNKLTDHSERREDPAGHRSGESQPLLQDLESVASATADATADAPAATELLEAAATLPPPLPVVPLSHNTFIVITTSLLILGYFLAVTVKSFALILSVVGSTGSTSISFTLPGLFGYKLIHGDSPLERVFRVLALVLVVWGLSVMVTCLYASLYL